MTLLRVPRCYVSSWPILNASAFAPGPGQHKLTGVLRGPWSVPTLRVIERRTRHCLAAGNANCFIANELTSGPGRAPVARPFHAPTACGGRSRQAEAVVLR